MKIKKILAIILIISLFTLTIFFTNKTINKPLNANLNNISLKYMDSFTSNTIKVIKNMKIAPIHEFKDMKTKRIIVNGKIIEIHYRFIKEENKTYLEYNNQSYLISERIIF